MANDIPAVPDVAPASPDDAIAALKGIRSRLYDHQNASPLRGFMVPNSDAPKTQAANPTKPNSTVQAPTRVASLGFPQP